MTRDETAFAARAGKLASALLLEPQPDSVLLSHLLDAYSVSHDVVRARIERRIARRHSL